MVEAGSELCSRCGFPIRPGEPWDLDHNDDGVGWRGVSHQDCNRRAPMQRKQNTYESNPNRWADDPAQGGFYGPPEADGVPIRWSRRWYDWREELASRS